MNDPNSRVHAAVENPRDYGVLEEFNFRPSVSYLRVVRNRDDETGEQHSAGGRTSCMNSHSPLRPPLVTGDKTLGDVTRDICAPMDRRPTRLWWTAFGVSLSALAAGCRGRVVSDRHRDRHLGAEQDGRLGVRHHELCLLGRHRSRGHADFRRAVSVPSEVADGRQSIGGSDDVVRRDVCRHLSADSHGATVAGVLDGALSRTHAGPCG